MLPNRFAVVLVAFAVSLAVLPSLAAAESFALPGKEILLFQSWYYGYNDCQTGAGGPESGFGLDCMGIQYYEWTPNIFYRVLIDANGKETVLDQHKTTGTRVQISRTSDIYGHKYVFYDLPPLNATIDQPGTYRIELRRIILNRPTDN